MYVSINNKIECSQKRLHSIFYIIIKEVIYMDNKEFEQELINEIILNIKPSYYKNYELNVRCPFCGDCVKNANLTHLSIRINKT